MAATAETANRTQEWSLYYSALKAQLMQKLGSVYGAVLPFATTEVVNWFWGEPNPQGGGELYNSGTYDFLNTRVAMTPEGALQPQGGALSLDMASAYRNITFGYSAADRQTFVSNTNNTAAQAGLLVSTYQGLYGTITAAQLAAAQAKTPPNFIRTPLDYIVDYMVRYVWAGKPSQNPDGTYSLGLDPYHTADLSSQLPWLPSSGAPVLSALAAYIAAAQPIAPLRNQLVSAMLPISALISAVSTPAVATGGVPLVNPIDGSTGRVGLGWSFKTATADLVSSLGLGGTAGGGDIKLSFTATYEDDHSLQVSVGGGGGGTIPVLDFLGISVGGKASYDYNSYVGQGESLTIEVDYPGVTVWEFGPQRFDGATTGWYDSTVIQQAVNNGPLQADGSAATTGYALATTSPYDWTSTTGTFGVLNGLVISQQPKVTIKYTTSQASDFHSKVSQSANLGISLFGIELFSANESTTTTTNEQSSTNGSFSVTIAPPPQQATGLMSTAWVVGGFVLWPGQGGA